MQLFRVFDWDGVSLDNRVGGPFYVPRTKQGKSRHDIPHLTGVFYTSLTALSPIAEVIKVYRGQVIDDRYFIFHGALKKSLVRIDLKQKLQLADLNDPELLGQNSLRLSDVLSRDRRLTQRQAEALYHKGFAGLSWPSTLNTSWTNVTLFEDRSKDSLELGTSPTPLTVKMPEVRESAKFLGVGIGPL